MHAFAALPALFSTLLAFLLLDVVLAGHNADHTLKRRHLSRVDEASADQRGVAVRGEFSLAKRFDQAKFSYYAAGLGACGKTNSASDFIVALNSAQFAGGSHCFEMITITINGRSTQAQIMDECPGCPFAGLDFSEGLFAYFASTSSGIIYGSWTFGASAPPPPPSPSPPPKPEPTTERPVPTPTPSPTSTTPKETPTSSTAAPSTTVSSSISVPASSSSVAPSTQAGVVPGNLDQFNAAFLQVAVAILAGVSGN